MGRNELVMRTVKEELPNYMGKAVEDIVRDMMARKLQFEPTDIGSWWNRKGEEIDFVSLNERTGEIVFGEIKWKERSVGREIIGLFLEKKERVEWKKGDRKEYFMFFSRNGFTESAKEIMKEKGIMGLELKDLAG